MSRHYYSQSYYYILAIRRCKVLCGVGNRPLQVSLFAFILAASKFQISLRKTGFLSNPSSFDPALQQGLISQQLASSCGPLVYIHTLGVKRDLITTLPTIRMLILLRISSMLDMAEGGLPFLVVPLKLLPRQLSVFLEEAWLS